MKNRISNFMKFGKIMVLSIIITGTLVAGLYAQDATWKESTSKDGKTHVSYSITTVLDAKGDKSLLIKDYAETSALLNYRDCISVMLDVSKHQIFHDDASSQIIRTISDNQWLVYYQTDNPWPVPDSDCVARMVYSENETQTEARFEFTAEPDEYESQGVKRMMHYHLVYVFKDLGNGMVSITESGESVPPVKVPMWLIESAFPKAQYVSMEKLVKLIQEMQNL